MSQNATNPGQANVGIESILDLQTQTPLQRLFGSQAFWVTIALLIMCAVMSYLQPDSFATAENFYNITRNFSFIGIMALGMTVVIATGGIDLSVGSIMGLTAVCCGLTLEAGYPWWLAVLVGLFAGFATGLINGLIIAFVGLSPFVTTLGMLAIARSVAVVLSGNRMLYKFGPSGPAFKYLGGGAIHLSDGVELSFPLLFLILLTLVLAVVYKMTAWGRHVLAIGGNEQAALLTGVPVKMVKVQAYVVSGLAAAFAAILNVGWSGSAINALGSSYELLAISAAVIGGANLMGGEASAFGAFIGAALIFTIRNALLMEGVDSNWQGTFVGAFLIAAVYLGKIRGARRD
ncbi:MAG: ABC transporter permease [Pseudomonadota bacterium]|nr:ABC transporter permease [Pseudomonadota bacterium]